MKLVNAGPTFIKQDCVLLPVRQSEFQNCSERSFLRRHTPGANGCCQSAVTRKSVSLEDNCVYAYTMA
jgi:hypothetical protein